MHEVTAIYDTGLSFEARIDEYSFKMDTTDETTVHAGPSPKKLLLAGLAGCTGIDVVSILNKMQVEFSDLLITVRAKLTEEHPRIYDEVSVIFSVKINHENKTKFERAVELSREKYCGVSAMFGHFAKLNWQVNYL